MTTCCLAGIDVAFRTRYPHLARLVAAYPPRTSSPSLTLAVSDEEILAEDAGKNRGAPQGMLEALALFRKFCLALPTYGGFFLHAACLSVDGRGIAVTAPSGVGKSTHAANWRTLLGERCRIVNGDKPLVRRTDDGFLAYGSPFSGKEGWHENTSVPLRALLFLERGERNEITAITPSAAFPHLFAATLPPGDEGGLALLLPLLSDLLSHVALFRLICTKDVSAAALAYETLFRKETAE